jgi:squalene synthase HpnC
MNVTAARPATAPPPAALPRAEDVMAQAGTENFPVALWVLGRRRREQLRSLYGYARLVDDAGDEAPGDRMTLLDAIEADLDRVYAGKHPGHPVLQRLAPTIAELRLPDVPFRRLLDANRRDQLISRYETFDALLDYCQLSAAPVGELVLHVFGAATEERIRLSDRICAALQVTEHLQDVSEDHERSRVYLPREDLERFGCGDRDLAAARPSPEFAALMAFEVERAKRLLAEGAPLIRSLSPRPAIAVAAFVAGGRAALDALADGKYVLAERPRPSRRLCLAALATTLGRRG